MPYSDYGGLLLLSCTRKQKEYLQTLQNNAFRICLHYKLADRFSERALHLESKLQSLEQRRKLQLLKLMYCHSKKVCNIKAVVRPTRVAENMFLIFQQNVQPSI